MDVCALPPVTFSNLNRGISRWYLGVEVVHTNFGNSPWSQQDQRGNYVEIDAQGLNDTQSVFPKNCAPADTSTCPGGIFQCITNQHILLQDGTSSVTFSASAFNFHITGCKFNGFSIAITFILTGTNPKPTCSPTPLPTQTRSPTFPTAASGILLLENSQSSEPMMRQNAPLYVVGGLTFLFVAVGVMVVQSRDQSVGARDSMFDAVGVQMLAQALEKKGGRVVGLKLIEVLLDFGLIGSAFVSECYFIALLLGTPRFRHLAGAVFVGRVIHLVVGSALIHLVITPAASLPWPFLPKHSLRQLCNLRNFKENIKLCGLLCLLGTFDVTLFRYLPWLHSQFSVETKGFPSPFLFMACISSKLLQSFFTMSCQFIFLSGTSRHVEFLALNVAVTLLIFLVNAIEAVLWSGFMLEWHTAAGVGGAAGSTAVAAMAAEDGVVRVTVPPGRSVE